MRVRNVVRAIAYSEMNNSRQFLLLQRPSGSWNHPQGGAKKGETEIASIRRELLEETGLLRHDLLEDTRTVARYTITKRIPNYEVALVAYAVKVDRSDSITLSDEHVNYEWVPYEEVLNRLKYQEQRDLLEKVYLKIST